MNAAPDLTNVPPIMRRKMQEAQKMLAEAAPAKETPPPAEPALSVPPVEETPAAATPAAEPASFGEVATEEMTKEQRYKVLEGMHRKAEREAREARQAAAEKAALDAELKAMREQLHVLKTAPPVAPVQAAPSEVENFMVETFGADALKNMESWMQSRGYVKQDDLKTVKDEVGQVRQEVHTSALGQFRSQLDDLAPGWERMNEQQGFIDYMNQEEGNTGKPRKEFAQNHLDAYNAPKLAAYFVDYASSAAPAAAPAPVAAKPKIDKQKLTSPPMTPPAARSVKEAAEAPVVGKSELAKFAEDVRTGKYRGRDAEMKAQQDKFDLAIRERRIDINA